MESHTVIKSLLLILITGSAIADDCTKLDPASGTSALAGTVKILKSGRFYQLYETYAGPAAGLDLVQFSSPGIKVLQAAGYIIGIIEQVFEGNVVYNSATDSCWNVQENYCFNGGKMINCGCTWGPFTQVNLKFGPTSPDGDGWSRIAAEPCGVNHCLYADSNQGDPLYTTSCDSNDDEQKFTFIPVGGANFLFLHKATLECIYVASDGLRTTTCNVDDRTQLFQWRADLQSMLSYLSPWQSHVRCLEILPSTMVALLANRINVRRCHRCGTVPPKSVAK